LRAQGFRKTVGETKRNELCQARLVAMRQITALMPAAKTSLRIFQFRRRRPAAFLLHQLSHIRIVRWPGWTRSGRLAHTVDIKRIKILRASFPERGSATRSSFARTE